MAQAFKEAAAKGIEEFHEGVSRRVEAYLAAADKAAGDEAGVAAFEEAAQDLVAALDKVAICIHLKEPKMQPEDHFGAEVQQKMIDVVNDYSGRFSGAPAGEKKGGAAPAPTLSSYLAGLAELHKAGKDRPDNYPADLDEKQLKAFHAKQKLLVQRGYRNMAAAAVHVADLLEKNKALIAKPKRDGYGYM